MTRKWMMAGVGLAVGMLFYKLIGSVRRLRVQREDGERLATWEEEGGALPERERF